MAKIIITDLQDALGDKSQVLKNCIEVGNDHDSLQSWVDIQENDFNKEPWFCTINRKGKKYYPLRAEWSKVKIEEEDLIIFIRHTGDAVSIIIAVVAVIVAVVSVLMIDTPNPAANEDPRTVYSIDGKSNSARLNLPIEDCYGRNKIVPSYIANPYVKYEGNNSQILYQHFSLGHGVFDIENIYLSDTLIDNFENVEYHINNTNVFNNNVVSSPEVSNLKLLGTNEEGYTEGIGGFVTNPPNTITNLLEIDYVMASGCYKVDDDGDIRSLGINVLWQYREVNSDGVGVGDWETLYHLDRRFSTNEAIRVTQSKVVPAARYEVKATRLNSKYKKTSGTNDITWGGLKAYLGNANQPSGLTTLSIKTRADSNTVSNKVTVLCKRKLPVWTGSTWVTQVTRNPIWAMVNILRASYGADLDDSALDLEKFKEEADKADTKGESFDFIFANKTTVFEAIKNCSFVARCTPLLEGSRMTLKRDEPSIIPTQVFNAANILNGTFKINRRMIDLEDYNGLKAEYLDHNTWKKETIVAQLPGQSGSKYKSKKLDGVTSRDHAVRLASYLWGSEYFNREIISFSTTQAGILATYGDLIKVVSDIPKWGQGGYVEAITNSNIITLSEKPVFSTGDHQVTFRDKLGGVYGPFIVDPFTYEEEGDEYKVILRDGFLDLTKVPIRENAQPPIYIFGKASEDGTLCRITKMVPSGPDNIKITALVENSDRFYNDGYIPPAITYPDLPEYPDVPSVDTITIGKEDESIKISWMDSVDPAATSYKVAISLDGITFEQEQTVVINYALFTYIGVSIYARVIPINNAGEGDAKIIYGYPDYPVFLQDDGVKPLVFINDNEVKPLVTA